MSSSLTTANVMAFLDGLEFELGGPHSCDWCGGAEVIARVIWWCKNGGHLSLCGHHSGKLPADVEVTHLDKNGCAIVEVINPPPTDVQNYGLAAGTIQDVIAGALNCQCPHHKAARENHSGAYGRPCECPVCKAKMAE